MSYTLTDISNNEAKQFAMYTIENRAIPNMVDGLKNVQRFYLYSSIKNSLKEFRKVSAVSGVVSDYGYQHGEASAAGAGQLMAADWNNNICLIEGRGSFGTRLVPVAGAPRYVYTRLHKNFNKYIKDIELSPTHEDPEHEPPKFYLPVIPLVLANGAKGIATGFATNILPRSEQSLIDACIEYIKTGDIKSKLNVSFPQFKGSTYFDSSSNRFVSKGILEKKTSTIWYIKEIPYGIDRESYIEILDKLEEEDKILSYEDMCSDKGFQFEIKLKNASAKTMTHDKMIKMLKLEKTYSENLNVIDINGKLKQYDDERDLIKDFVNYRMGILQRRIELAISKLTENLRVLTLKRTFIEEVLDENIVFKGKSKDNVVSQIKTRMKDLNPSDDDCDILLKMNIMSLTQDMIKDLESKIAEVSKEVVYWQNETPKSQYLTDLNL